MTSVRVHNKKKSSRYLPPSSSDDEADDQAKVEDLNSDSSSESGLHNEQNVSVTRSSKQSTSSDSSVLITPKKVHRSVRVHNKKKSSRHLPPSSSDDETDDQAKVDSARDSRFKKNCKRRRRYLSYYSDEDQESFSVSMTNETEKGSLLSQDVDDDNSSVSLGTIFDEFSENSDRHQQARVNTYRRRYQSSSETQTETETESEASTSSTRSNSEDGYCDISSDGYDFSQSEEDTDTDIFVSKVYEGSNLTQGASYVLILQFSRKYKLSRKAHNDLLTLIRLHCPDDAKDSFPRTYHNLLKRLMPTSATGKLKKTRVCKKCTEKLEDNADSCPNDHPVNDGNTKDDSFFIDVPLEPQLKDIIEGNANEILASCARQISECKEKSTTYKDITDGALYKNFYKKIHRRDSDATQRHHISLMISTDGAPVFKSVNSSIWPLYAVILELPMDIRYTVKNVILIGLWYGPKKPNINVFLKNTLMEISTMEKDGLSTSHEGQCLTFKVHLHCCICDLPGKALVLLLKLFNGKFGCSVCFHPGLKLPIRGNVRTYPYSDKYKCRTAEETRFHALVAEASGISVFGVKGFSVLLNFMSIPDGCPIDYMHCILQGTGKWILNALIDTKNKEKPFYLPPASQRIINSRLEAIRVPHDMDRKPRSLDYLSKWKATEIQQFLLYYGLPVLKGVVPSEYFHHFALLATALWILVKNEITQDELSLAGANIKSFCRLLKHYYGERSETINAHSLTHLEQQVINMGPLWTHSSFAFEAMIAHTLSNFKGTRGVADQMVANYLIERKIKPLQKQLQNSEAEDEVKRFSNALLLSKSRVKWNQQSSSVSFSEPTLLKPLSAEEATAINDLLVPTYNLNAVNSQEQCIQVQRVEIDGKVFHSKSYKRAGKSCSSIVQMCTSDRSHYFYGEVQKYVSVRSLPIAIVKRYNQVVTSICSVNIDPPLDTSILMCTNAGLLGSHHVPVSGPPESDVFAVECENIISTCILVKANEPFVFAYITPVTNINCK